MRRAILAAVTVAALVALLAAGNVRVGLYGRPGSPNGGVYLTRTTTCADVGLELWGRFGPFADLDC